MSTQPRIGDLSAAERNKRPIFDALADWLVDARDILEIGSGDGTHARYARERLPHARWQTSEAPGHIRGLTAALVDAHDEARLPSPLALDVRSAWPAQRYDAIFAANVAHIMHEDAVAAMFAGVASHLVAGGLFCLYGPFFDDDETPGEGNLAFDRALRSRDPGMGLRRREALDALAGQHGLVRVARLVMPSDNRLLIWRRDAD
ncbi:DUF938 domain-containing protein [Salinisphaera hydrothermalis]|uniref:Methylase n=1 Tax=Salinisphaera hydrothermalis (strain C41B8) TaxID=1304275 RepID=A0A084IR60_SALHC|nr:DUF938 domain-containing protein [Salinisphaera hydrothermalis]KEZ79194.1 hypothetical protein C41B8_00555 [Salinisphaera hydrothermalis C41B8]